ncbi:response regulator [Rhizobium sp. G187]|uniref:response regulator n=1 Tax=Rhizobium sp. G187 TaxID=3451352 RepID=UPI003EE77A86
MKELTPVSGEGGLGALRDILPDAPLQPALLEAMSEALQAAVLVYDRNDHLIFASRNVTNYLNLPTDTFRLGTRLRDILETAYAAGWRHLVPGQGNDETPTRDEWLTRQIAAHWRERFEMQVWEDGKRWTRYSKRRLASGFGFCIMTDVTDQKRREDQWRADVERVQLTEEILDNLAHPVFVQDRSLHVVAVNKIFCSTLSVGSEQALGSPLHDVFEHAVAERLLELSREVLETGVTASLALEMRVHRSALRMMRIHMQRVGKPGRYFLVSSLDDGGALADSGDGISGHSQAEALPSVMDADKEKAGGRLAGRKALVVSGEPAFEREMLDLLSLLGLDSCCVRNDDELEAFLDVARSVSVSIDLAIVDIRVDMQCLGLIQAQEIDYLTVEDGEEPSDLAFAILDRLTALQSDPAPVDDWEICTEDDPPVVVDSVPVIEKPQPPSRQPLILVAEDNEINQIVFSQILDGLGHAYRICADGEEVIAAWRDLNPALILMDVTLPVVNGFEAASRIRAAEDDTPARMPIIGVLPHAFDRDREACYAAGMDEVILKPLSPDVIEQVIQRHAPELARSAA